MRYKCFLLANSKKQPITDITKTRLEHSPIGELLVNPGYPDIHSAAGPLLRGFSDARDGADDGQHDDPLDPPFLEGLDGGGAGPARSDHRIEEDGQTGRARARRVVVGQVVVVFYRGEGGRFSIQTEVVHGDRRREEGLDG